MSKRDQFELHLQEELFVVSLDKTSRKNINIRIKPDNIIYVSKPAYISKESLVKYLMDKESWIIKQASRVNKTHDKRSNYIGEESVIIFDEVFNTEDVDRLETILLEYIQSTRAFYDSLLKKQPNIKIKRLKGKWGYCVPSKNLLVFNLNLVHYPKEVIDYVILHEYTHLEIPNHSKEFYDFIEKVMPNYKEHIKYLREH